MFNSSKQSRTGTSISDADLVANAAGILEIAEFQFWKLSYSRWHGRPPPSDLECSFGRHLADPENVGIPYYVRDFARDVVEMDPDLAISLRNPHEGYLLA